MGNPRYIKECMEKFKMLPKCTEMTGSQGYNGKLWEIMQCPKYALKCNKSINTSIDQLYFVNCPLDCLFCVF